MNDIKSPSVDISVASIVKAVLVLLVFYALYLLSDLLLVILTAVVIASAVEPATKWFEGIKVPRIPAVITIYGLIIMFVVGTFYFFVPPLLNDALTFASALPQYTEQLNIPTQIADKAGTGVVNGISESFSLEGIVESVKGLASGLSGGVFRTATAVFGGVFGFILVVIISFYLAVQKNGIENFLKLISPISQQNYIVDLWKRAQLKIGRWMQGQLLLGFLIGVLVYLGLTVLGVPYALLLAVLAALFELIPVFGPILAAIPAVALGFVSGGVSLGFMTLGLYAIIQQFENHLIYPLVVSKVVGVPPLLVIISLIAGGTLFGFLGVLLSVPLSAALVEYLNDVAREKHLA